jgi:hypothetical protein
VDFDDFHQFNIFFGHTRNGETTGAGAVQFLNFIWLGDSRSAAVNTTFKMPQPAEREQGDADDPLSEGPPVNDSGDSNAYGIAYGIGSLGIEQQKRLDGPGTVLGNSFWTTDADNQIVGPKAGLVWTNRRGPWSFDLQSLFLLGFNSGQVSDSSKLGMDLIPGALNRLFYIGPTYAANIDSRQLFTPVGEFRAQTRLRLNHSLSLSTAWTSLIVGNYLSVSNEFHTTFPDITFAVERDNLFVHQLYCGMEFVH